MDPNATLKLLLDAFHDSDREAAFDAIENLMDWMTKGGFLPNDPRPKYHKEAIVPLPDTGGGLFRRLSPEEETQFRWAARRDYHPLEDIKGTWHPVYVDECRRMNERYYQPNSSNNKA